MKIEKQKFRIAIISGIIILLILFKVFNTKGSALQTGSKRAKTDKALVSVHIVKPQSVQEKIISSGTILANEDIELKCETSGRIAGVYFKEGSAVKKGDMLLKINDADLQAQFLKAEAALNLVRDKEQRQKGLLEKEIISKEDYETSIKELESGKADVQLVKAQIEKTEIRAPFDGIIGLTDVTAGSYINTGTKVANLVSLRPLKVEFSVPERYVSKITPGSELAFTLTGADAPYSARVFACEPKIDGTTRTVKIKAYCSNPDSRVLPGSFARVEMIIKENAHALLVPSEALVPDINGYKVFIVYNNAAAVRPVETGIRNEKSVEIIKGLQEGDSVIVSGVLMLRPGMKIEISEIK